MKIRLEGTLQEIDAAAKQLRLIFRVGSVSKPYKNRNSDLHRVYIEVEPEPPQAEPELIPSYHGQDCPANGEHPGIECCCDECDYYLECFPDWKECDDARIAELEKKLEGKPPHQFSPEFCRKMHELCPSIDPVTGKVHRKEDGNGS